MSSEFDVYYLLFRLDNRLNCIWTAYDMMVAHRLDELFGACSASICLTIHEIDWNSWTDWNIHSDSSIFIIFSGCWETFHQILSSFVHCRASRHHFLIVAPPGVDAVPIVLAWVDAMAPNCKWPVGPIVEEKLLKLRVSWQTWQTYVYHCVGFALYQPNF